MQHDGTLRAGVTDVAAFGRPAPMFTWLSLYREVMALDGLQQDVARWKSFNTHDHDKGHVEESCTPEGILAYWLGINGIPVRTEWRLQMNLLRQDGESVFACPNGREWLCPGL